MEIFKKNIGISPEIDFLEREITRWRFSPEREMQIKGYLYYNGEQDILRRERTVIGEDGELQSVRNLPNNRVVDNQYAKLVNQKANYLLGRPVTIYGENKEYIRLLRQVLGKKFQKTLKSAGKDMLKGGIAWLYPYPNENGLEFRLLPAYEIMPLWRDSSHTVLDMAVRVYTVTNYQDGKPKILHKAEIYDMAGVRFFTLNNGRLEPEQGGRLCYVTAGRENTEAYLNWDRIPLIPLKYGETEIPLLKKVKSLQDGINAMLSDFQNNMQEDARNTIMVLKNYDGASLGEFRKNLAAYGAVKVRCEGDAQGGVDTLEVKVNAENYKAIIEIFKKAIIENGMGYDAKNEKISGSPNQMNIKSMYSDIDLDANDMETELQAAFQDILWFVNAYLENTGKGDYSKEEVEFIFNRDMIVNESEVIADCKASMGMLSDTTIISQHPWVEDPQKELERLRRQDVNN